MSKRERDEFATLIYYPAAIIGEKKAPRAAGKAWFLLQLHRLVEVCRSVASKYTRSKVRKALPPYFDYIIDELINMDRDDFDKEAYYGEIFTSIIELGRAEAFIVAITDLIKRLAVDCLHIVGDVFDRGESPDKILDLLTAHHNADVQWGNHDIQWIGAHMGNEACLLSVVDLSLKYDNADLLEEGYGISLRKLSLYAAEEMDDDPRFYPVGTDAADAGESVRLLAKMRKAAFLMQLKAEGHIIERRPEYKMEGRNILRLVDLAAGTFCGAKLNNASFPNVDPADPLRFTPAERDVIDSLKRSFRTSEKLRRHIAFFMAKGSAYKISNGNLIFHGCIPLEPDGSYMQFCGHGGRDLLDYCDRTVRRAYAAFREGGEDEEALDFCWYLWCGRNSPFSGREFHTFERACVDDKSTWTEPKNPYFDHWEDEDAVRMILSEFGLDPESGHIINGHTPVKATKGESPVKAGGRLFIIDGGFCKAYQKTTGIAGYTLIYSSHGVRLKSHRPFEGVAKVLSENADMESDSVPVEYFPTRRYIADTDEGERLRRRIDALGALLAAYRTGELQQR